jgi:hypothetical protein
MQCQHKKLNFIHTKYKIYISWGTENALSESVTIITEIVYPDKGTTIQVSDFIPTNAKL